MPNRLIYLQIAFIIALCGNCRWEFITLLLRFLHRVDDRLLGIRSQRNWICVLLALQRSQEHVGHIGLTCAILLLNLLLEFYQLLLNLRINVASLVARRQFEL